MNKNIKLAVAGAVLALSATANAGIIIPAGDWTLDINGNVNAYTNYTRAKDANVIEGGHAVVKSAASVGQENKYLGINTGLLPTWLGFTGTTRQNDVDVSFTISMQPNVSDNTLQGDNNAPLFRQSFMTFGDKSWGSVKLGKDIGVFASDAILNDMTLLGVGAGAAGVYGNAGGSGAATTLGGIGTGYIYAAWKGQVAYTTPNFNGFQATVAITNPNQSAGTGNQDRFGFEGKASYSFAANDVTGKVWASGASYDVSKATVAASDWACSATDNSSPAITTPATACASTLITLATGNVGTTAHSYTASMADIGANINVAGLGLTGYYYNAKGAGTTFMGNLGATAAGAKRDSDGGYVQATYVLPTKTKLGFAYGISSLDLAGGETNALLVKDNERYTVGAYHPLTKHLNLVAEYNQVEAKAQNGVKNESNTYSAGAILFF
jgi:predicted porin